MTIEFTPIGDRCNLSCTYCYENPMREAGNLPDGYDLDAAFTSLKKAGSSFIVFGGEPLLMSLPELEKIFDFGFKTYGVNGIQTNGTLITDRHIELFKKYNVNVGISVDGPGELNAARLFAGSPKRTLDMTNRTLEAIEKLCKAGRHPGLIITLHKLNGDRSVREQFKAWFLSLESMGIRSARLHLMESDGDVRNIKMPIAEYTELVTDLMEFEEKVLKSLKFDIFKDMVNLLRGDESNVSCVWNACDPYTTNAVHGVGPDGTLKNCGRVDKDGVSLRKADSPGHQRQLALYHTPQEYGGCAGCRFFLMCKGECPGTGRDGDWRNRSEHCEILKVVFEHYERRLVDSGEVPLSVSTNRRQLEQRMLQRLDFGRIDVHNDHTDSRTYLGVVPCKD